MEDFKSAFDLDMLAVRYTPLLAQYDYIVGDISAEQLRLKGFIAMITLPMMIKSKPYKIIFMNM